VMSSSLMAAPPYETDGALANEFAAHPHAESAEIAQLILGLEPRLGNPQARSEVPYLRCIGTASQQQLGQHLASLQHSRRRGLNLHLLADRVVARSHQPRAATVGDLHGAKPAGSIGLQRAMVAQRGNGDAQFLGRLKDGSTVGDLYRLPINDEFNHRGTPSEWGTDAHWLSLTTSEPSYSTITASNLQVSRHTPHLMHRS